MSCESQKLSWRSWDSKVIVIIDILHGQVSITSVDYYDISRKVKAVYLSKRGRVPNHNVSLLHETRDSIPLHSPDLWPCNYHLFEPLKKVLAWVEYENYTYVEQFVSNWLLTRPSSFITLAIKTLPVRWQKYLDIMENM